uniref:RNase H type-1 domain-containing protein n=1 Tax=Pseudo-nitzschia australis TaxID=44445 RepID=A0A7S4EGY1_9STRA
MCFYFCRLASVSSLLFEACLILLYTLAMTAAMTISAPSDVKTKPTLPTITTTHIKLQFDGCLRPPRDPGFPTIPYRMAVCAACVGVVHDGNNNIDNNNNNNWKDSGINNERCDNDERTVRPLAVGSVALPVSTEITSQHAEYEGLLLGLEWLGKIFSSPNWNEEHISTENLTAIDIDDDIDTNSDIFSTMQQKRHKALISIEGDCKTVIDQLSGKSIPRKLEPLHQRAQSLLDQLTSNNHGAIITTDSGKTKIKCETGPESNASTDTVVLFETEYCHIPRSQNSISDSLCNNLMNIIAAKSWKDNIQQLEEAEKDVIGHELSPSCAFTTPRSLSNIIETASKTTKYSLRPPLYEKVANLAAGTKDYKLLVEIGERLAEEGSFNSKPNNNSRGRDSSNRSISSKRKGINYQIRGQRGLGKEKNARFLERKHRILLSTDVGNEDTKKGVEILKYLGDITEGDWDTVASDVWRPMVEKWFVSARFEAEDDLLPLWVDSIDKN